MTAMRITVGSQRQAAVDRIQAASSKLADKQQQLSSGLRISKPSDDPAGTTQAMALSAQMSRNTQYTANASDAISFLSTADTAYSSVQTQLQKASTLVLQAMNGSSTATSQTAIADQLDSLSNGILAVANTSYNGQTIFGGTSSGSAAFDSSGNYLGDSGSLLRTVGDGNTVTINQTGTAVFGANGSNVFSTLQSISTALKNGTATDASLGAQLTTLQSQMQNVSAQQAQEGAVYNQVQQAQTLASTVGTQLKTSYSDVTEVDFAQSVIDVTTANTAYQAALQTTSIVSQQSLLDFLK